MIDLILKIDAAKHIGKDEYPPIPNTIEGRLNIKNIIDLNIEKIIIITENKSPMIFFLIKGDEGIFIKFKFS